MGCRCSESRLEVEPPALGVCDVCWIVDGDATPKPIMWCGVCKAWICETCKKNFARRASAALKRFRDAFVTR